METAKAKACVQSLMPAQYRCVIAWFNRTKPRLNDGPSESRKCSSAGYILVFPFKVVTLKPDMPASQNHNYKENKTRKL